MESLYTILYNTYVEYLHKLNIGYEMEKIPLQHMFDLINAIDYIENGNPSITDIYKIIAQYE